MKRLVEEADASLSALTDLVASAERHDSGPFAKRAVLSRIQRELATAPSGARFLTRPALLGVGALLVAATAAAAGYSFLGTDKSPQVVTSAVPTLTAPVRPLNVVEAPAVPAESEPAPVSPSDLAPAPSNKRAVERRAGEDPSQVAEAVRALRKQGDAARAQVLLDQYLRENPRGALAEDALALSIEAAAARKDPRAADYARRYLARYPNGRFRSMAERVLSR